MVYDKTPCLPLLYKSTLALVRAYHTLATLPCTTAGTSRGQQASSPGAQHPVDIWYH